MSQSEFFYSNCWLVFVKNLKAIFANWPPDAWAGGGGTPYIHDSLRIAQFIVWWWGGQNGDAF